MPDWPDAEAPELLTTAQLRVAECVRRGLSNRQIAEHLGISRHTVESHLASVFKRLGIASRVDLAVLLTEARDRLSLNPRIPDLRDAQLRTVPHAHRSKTRSRSKETE